MAKEAGAAILGVYDGDHAVEYKNDKSPVTAADKSSTRSLVEGLRLHFPDIPYFERKDRTRFWCADPLEGTKEFIKRNG